MSKVRRSHVRQDSTSYNVVRKISVRDDFTIDLDSLDKQVIEDRKSDCYPVWVVGIAGTTNTGVVDPLSTLAEFCRAQGFVVSLHAAYEGPAVRAGSPKKLFRGLERADSLVVDPHKWLYVPAGAACILVREPAALRQAFQVTADYLKGARDSGIDSALDFKDYGHICTGISEHSRFG